MNITVNDSSARTHLYKLFRKAVTKIIGFDEKTRNHTIHVATSVENES